MIPKQFTTYAGWRRAAKEMGATRFEGDKDIAGAWAANGNYVGEWDGETGWVAGVLRGQSRASRMLLRGGLPGPGGDTMARGNPMNPLPPEQPLYAEYLRPLPHEEPFTLGRRRWTFCKVRNSDGREDVGVYSHDEDLAYEYLPWRRMMSIEGVDLHDARKPRQAVAVRPSWIGSRQMRQVVGRNDHDGMTPEEA